MKNLRFKLIVTLVVLVSFTSGYTASNYVSMPHGKEKLEGLVLLKDCYGIPEWGVAWHTYHVDVFNKSAFAENPEMKKFFEDNANLVAQVPEVCM